MRRTVNLRRLTATVVAALMTTTAACDRLLDVENPASVPIEALDDPALMQTLESASHPIVPVRVPAVRRDGWRTVR